MFVKDERVVVYELPDGTVDALEEGKYRAFRNDLPADVQEEINSIWIPIKMGIHRKKVVQDALMTMSATPKAAGDDDTTAGDEAGATVGMSFGRYTMALLEHNILKWQGPAFTGMAVTRANIHRLDDDAPLVKAVIAEIGKRNPLKGSPDPKSAAPVGSTSDGDSAEPDA